MYTKEDIKDFKQRGIKKEVIEKQLENFKNGFDFVELEEAATLENGIKIIPEEEKTYLIDLYDEASQKADIVKMVPASGSATRMFKDLFNFLEKYDDSYESFLGLVQERGATSMNEFFHHLDEYPFAEHLRTVIWNDKKDIYKLIEKRMFKEVIEYILLKKGLNYGDTPKALVDFHVYRDFVRTAFDEHLVEAALYAKKGKDAVLHFTVSEEYLPRFQDRLKKVTRVFEEMFNVKYKVTFSIQKPSTDTISVDEKGEIVRDENGKILFRPGGHGALIYNLNDIKADIIFIKNIDNVTPDRNKADTIKYKKLLGGTLFEIQSDIFERLDLLDKRGITDEQLDEIENFIEKNIGYKNLQKTFKDRKERIRYLYNLLDRPIRVCGMVRNEGEPGGGPFWVKQKDGSSRLMIIESAQINSKDKKQKKIFESSTHFNPVDLVCGTRGHKGKDFDLTKYIASEQGFITSKSYKGKDIKVQELPGLWNGAMAEWITIFVEVPLTTFTPVKTVFDLRRTEHRNVFSK